MGQACGLSIILSESFVSKHVGVAQLIGGSLRRKTRSDPQNVTRICLRNHPMKSSHPVKDTETNTVT